MTKPNSLYPVELDIARPVAEIVAGDYRAADVFRKYGIGYCCGGKWPVNIACEMQGVDEQLLKQDLVKATRTVMLPSQLAFEDWDIIFLVDYLVNVHHQYLTQSLPQTAAVLDEFIQKHKKKYPYFEKAGTLFRRLEKKLLESIRVEEEILFPYLRQLVYAHRHKEPYAAIFVRTLRKPLEENLFSSHETISGIILTIRELTNKYISPEDACLSHRVVLSKLKELDNDLVQHLSLEQEVLFPKAMAIEKEVLNT